MGIINGSTKVAVRLGDFELLPKKDKHSKESLKVEVEINGKKAAMVIEEQYNHEAKMVRWRFVTGDLLIDDMYKHQTDFSVFELVDITVDISSILTDATEFFKKKKEEEERKASEQVKIERTKEYDNHFFITGLKPALEAKGYTVTVPTTKEDFLANSFVNVTLRVNENVSVEHDYNKWVEARNFDSGYDLRVVKHTKSKKIEKIVTMVEDVINTRKRKIASLLKEKEGNLSSQQELKNLLNVDILEKKKWSCNPYDRKSLGYEITYFEDEALLASFTKGTGGFRLNPTKVLSNNKVKRIYDILREEE